MAASPWQKEPEAADAVLTRPAACGRSAWLAGTLELLSPAGFREGVAVPLVTPDGRFLGLFGANTVSAAPLSETTFGLLQSMAPIIAHARGTTLYDGISRASTLLGLPLAGVLIAVSGPARLYVGGHWLSDVVAGYLLAVAFVCTSTWFFMRWRSTAGAAGPGVA